VREEDPIAIDAAVSRVYAKAREFITASDHAGHPADGWRTYTEPDKTVYITADKEAALIAKWENKDCGSDRFHSKASGSSSGALVDLKLQLDHDWGTWKANTSPFVYHIPIDTWHSPAMKEKEEQTKRQKAAAAKRDEEQAAAAEKAKEEKEAKEKAEKERKAKELQRDQAMRTKWNELLKAKKVKEKDKTEWEKNWHKDNDKRYS